MQTGRFHSDLQEERPTGFPDTDVKAARYAVLQRIAPLLRHSLIRHLQPVALLAELAVHQLSGADASPASARSSAKKIGSHIQGALLECDYMTSWLTPDKGAAVLLNEGVRECADLVAASMDFHGYRFLLDLQESAGAVHRDALRMLLTAAILASSADVDAPARITIRSTAAEPGTARLEISAEPVDNGNGNGNGLYLPRDQSSEKLTWHHVKTMADWEGVGAELTGHRMRLAFRLQAPHGMQASAGAVPDTAGSPE